jgi:hypothetical protein
MGLLLVIPLPSILSSLPVSKEHNNRSQSNNYIPKDYVIRKGHLRLVFN